MEAKINGKADAWRQSVKTQQASGQSVRAWCRQNDVSVPPTAVGDGVVYLRTDAAGGLKPYVGQSESLARYLVRQSEHANDFPNASFQFDVLGRANPGTDLDVMEEGRNKEDAVRFEFQW